MSITNDLFLTERVSIKIHVPSGASHTLDVHAMQSNMYTLSVSAQYLGLHVTFKA